MTAEITATSATATGCTVVQLDDARVADITPAWSSTPDGTNVTPNVRVEIKSILDDEDDRPPVVTFLESDMLAEIIAALHLAWNHAIENRPERLPGIPHLALVED